MKKNLVQTTSDNSNILVQTKESNGNHYSHLNFEVDILKKVSNPELISFLEQHIKTMPENEKIKLAKQLIQKEEKFAYSHITDKKIDIQYGDIVEFKKIISS